MDEKPTTLDQLADAVLKQYDLIQFGLGQVNALTAIVAALMQSHPDPRNAAVCIAKAKAIAEAVTNAQPVDEEFLDGMADIFSRLPTVP